MSGFVVINGQRLAYDDDDDEDYEDTFDVGVEVLAREKTSGCHTEERRVYDEYCRSIYDKTVEELREEREQHEERVETTRRRQRYGDDYVGEYDDGEESELLKKSRNAAAAASTTETTVDETFLPITDFGQDAEWYIERESTVDKEKDYVHIMNPRQRDFERLLGPGESRVPEHCFACDYLCNPLANQIYMDQWQKIVTLWQHGVVDVNMSWSSLGMHLYKVFTETIVATMVKMQSIPKDSVVWSPYGMLYHFRYECNDELITSTINARELNYTLDVIRNNELYLKHPSTGRTVVSKEALAKIHQVAQIRVALSKPMVGVGSSSSSSSTPGGSSSILAGKGNPLLKKPQAMTTRELLSRPNYTNVYSRHS